MTPGRVTLRIATTADVASAERTVEAAYARHELAMGEKPAPMLGDYSLLIEQGRVHVAVDCEIVLGLIVMWPRDDYFYIDNIAVVPDAQGRGVGAALLAHAEVAAAQIGAAELRLYTNVTMTENIRYYVAKGFVETHRAADEGYDRVYFSRRI